MDQWLDLTPRSEIVEGRPRRLSPQRRRPAPYTPASRRRTGETSL